MREIERLYRLQELDEELAAGQQELQELAGRRREQEQALLQACAERARLERELLGREHRLRQAEGALSQVETRLREMEAGLYGGALRSEKEMAARQAELEHLRHERDDLESRALQQMLELDEAREAAHRAAQAEADREREAEQARGEAAEAEAALQERLLPLRAAREALVAEVAPSALALYERVRQTTGRPVARVVGNRCEGCRLDVPLLTRKAALGESLVRCENCGRLLFLAEA